MRMSASEGMAYMTMTKHTKRHTMNIQEVFDKVVLHARTQQVKSVSCSPFDFCRYRDGKGNKCFIGALITDEHYTPKLENKRACTPAVSRALTASGCNPCCFPSYALDQLQEIHDEYNPKEWGFIYMSPAVKNI